MKSRFYALIALLLLVTASAIFYLTAFSGWIGFLNTRAVSQLTQAIHLAKTVEILHLSSSPKSRSDKSYFTKRFPEEYFITGSLTLDATQTKSLCEILKDLFYITDGGAACHAPGYILAFKDENRTLLTCTLCLDCSNFEISPLPFACVWVSFIQKGSPLRANTLERFLKENAG